MAGQLVRGGGARVGDGAPHKGWGPLPQSRKRDEHRRIEERQHRLLALGPSRFACAAVAAAALRVPQSRLLLSVRGPACETGTTCHLAVLRDENEQLLN